MNIYKRAKAVVEHDRAELEAERLETELRSNARVGRVTLFVQDCRRWYVARYWLGWAKREMMRHGCR